MLLNKLRVALFGSDYISVQCAKKLLPKLASPKFMNVVTPFSPPTKGVSLLRFAKQNKVRLVTVQKETDFLLRDFHIPKHEFDLGVVASFGYKIPERIIKSFPLGIINLHPSLLPKYRGAAPIQHALLDDEKETGVSVLEVSTKIDSGNILSQKKYNILKEDTFATLIKTLSEMGSQLLLDTIENLEDLRKTSKRQNELIKSVSTAPKIEREFGRIQFAKMTSSDIFLRWRALFGFLPVYVELRTAEKTKKIHIMDCAPLLENCEEAKSLMAEGTCGIGIFNKRKRMLIVKCKENSLLGIKRLKAEKRQEMTAKAFINGLCLKQPERTFLQFLE